MVTKEALVLKLRQIRSFDIHYSLRNFEKVREIYREHKRQSKEKVGERKKGREREIRKDVQKKDKDE